MRKYAEVVLSVFMLMGSILPASQVSALSSSFEGAGGEVMKETYLGDSIQVMYTYMNMTDNPIGLNSLVVKSEITNGEQSVPAYLVNKTKFDVYSGIDAFPTSLELEGFVQKDNISYELTDFGGLTLKSLDYVIVTQELVPSATVAIGNKVLFGYSLNDVSAVIESNEWSSSVTTIVENPFAEYAFPDVSADHTFVDYIEMLSMFGVIGGYSDGTYRPENPVTRAQLAKFIVNGFALGDDDSGEVFPDVDPESSLAPYIQVLKNKGIINGYGDGTYRPNEPVTRGAATKFIVNAMEASGVEIGIGAAPSPDFSDVKVGDTFEGYITYLGEQDVIGGYSDGTFRPDNILTRGAMAKIVSLAMGVGVDGFGSQEM